MAGRTAPCPKCQTRLTVGDAGAVENTTAVAPANTAGHEAEAVRLLALTEKVLHGGDSAARASVLAAAGRAAEAVTAARPDAAAGWLAAGLAAARRGDFPAAADRFLTAVRRDAAGVGAPEASGLVDLCASYFASAPTPATGSPAGMAETLSALRAVLALADRPLPPDNRSAAAPTAPAQRPLDPGYPVTGIAAAAVGIVGCLTLAYFLTREPNGAASGPASAPTEPYVRSDLVTLRAKVDAYFLGQERGEKDWDFPMTFNACRSHTILSAGDEPWFNDRVPVGLNPENLVQADGRGWVQVRVEHSDARGVPLVRDYKVWLFREAKDKPWRIYLIPSK